MSGKGNCYDNAVTESFFHSIKVESLNNYTFLSREGAKRCIFEYIEVFYKTKRRHSYMNYISPVNFERVYEFRGLKRCG